jgi:trimethyllysine dioxygenase
MLRFRYNNDDRAPLTTLAPADVPLFYRHLHVLTRATRDPAMAAMVRLRPGDGLLVDNHRVLHGRHAFSGARNLLGWYMDRDELLSRARRLALVQ